MSRLASGCGSLFQAATGAPDDQIVIGIQEVPPSQAMEMGQIMRSCGLGRPAPFV